MKPTMRQYSTTAMNEDDDASVESGGGNKAGAIKKASKKKSNDAYRKSAIQQRRTHKERKLRQAKVFNGGRWSKQERLEFLRGLRQFGPGQWKKIQTILTTRSNIQIKSHGQKVLQRLAEGENIYEELDFADAIGEDFSSPAPKQPKIVSADSSLASTLCADGKGGDERQNDDASIVSEISWTGSVAPEDAGRSPKLAGTIAGPPKSSSNSKTRSMPLKKRILREQATTPMQVNLDEATVVVALFELANPVKLHSLVASSAAKAHSESVQIMEV